MKLTTINCILVAVLLFASCKKESITLEPIIDGGASLTTFEAATITNVSAVLGGTITDVGSCAITVHGLAISTSHNPAISDITFEDNVLTSTGDFRITASPLLPGTTYFARAFATNCKGTSYGNEITFTTTTGGGSTVDTGYFKLTTGGVTYFSYDLLDPLSDHIFPEGDTRIALCTIDATSQIFNVTSQSTFVLDAGQSFGYSFSYSNPDVTGVGTYTFGKASNAEKNIELTIRTATGEPDQVLNPGFNAFQNTGNFSRHLVDNNCVSTEITSSLNTLIITRWGEPGTFIEGTMEGTLYEIAKSSFNCTNSTSKQFSVEFKLIRLQ